MSDNNTADNLGRAWRSHAAVEGYLHQYLVAINMSEGLEESLREKLDTRKLEKLDSSSSGCINRGYCFLIDYGRKIFVKINASRHATQMFDGEFESLKQIQATRTIRAPEPLTVVHNYDDNGATAIAMEYLDLAHLTNDVAKKLGKNLADLHDYNNKVARYNERASKWIGGNPPSVAMSIVNDDKSNHESEDEEDRAISYSKHSMPIKKQPTPSANEQVSDRFVPRPGTDEVTQFGFDVPTSCGLIPQVNDWTDDWVSFYARHRLDKTIRSLLSDHGDRELSEQWSHLQHKIDKFFSDYKADDDKIVPALLHGDLWSGNLAQSSDGSEGIIYDPCSFYGHSEYEFGIARMFGAIPPELEESYFEWIPKKKLFEKRNKLYQLFHHLNHWDHFGKGYRPSSLKIMKDLNVLELV